MAPSLPSSSIVIPTYRRPEYLRRCLEHLQKQTVRPLETVVVDASPDDLTRRVVEGFGDVRYLRNHRGAGSTATSRSIGVESTEGQVIAFLDDDAFAAPDWLEQLLLCYRDDSVAGVGGRTRNGRPGEEFEGASEIGLLLPNGRLTGNFAAAPDREVEVDHLLGANMSWRRAVIDRLGGIHDYYPGTCLREETDLALRARRAGYRILYTPAAVVDHVAGPYARGRRFDLRYAYYGQRNHVVLLSRTLGRRSPQLRRYRHSALREAGTDLRQAVEALGDHSRTAKSRARGLVGGASRAAAKVAGLGIGGVQALRLDLFEGPSDNERPTRSVDA